MGFFNTIEENFGAPTAKDMRSWSNFNNKLSSTLNHRIFLLRCRRQQVFPNHIHNRKMIHLPHADIRDGNHLDYINRMKLKLDLKILNVEIKLTNNNIAHYERRLTSLEQKIRSTIPPNTWLEFRKRQMIKFTRKFREVKQRQQQKLIKLIREQKTTDFINIEDKWLRNLTDITIPQAVKKTLSLGPKFSVHEPKKLDYSGLLADVDFILNRTDPERRDILRARATNILTNFIHKNRTPTNTTLLKDIYLTKNFLKQNPDLVVTRSDKGNATVLMHKDTYLQKSLDLLLDDASYERLNSDPTLTFQNRINRVITKLKNEGKIDNKLASSLKTYNAVSPKFYTLPKIHKNPLGMRPITSCINTPNSKISKFVKDILTKSYNSNNRYYIRDTFDFHDQVSDLRIPKDHIMASLDVISLYTNITFELVVKSIRKRWDSIKTLSPISLDDFIAMVRLVFETTYCQFNENFYKQIKGTPMGADASSIIAQMVVDDLLDEALSHLPFSIFFIKKFVDDLFIVTPQETLQEIVQSINAYDDNIQFTFEVESNGTLPYLDLKLTRNKQGCIICSWYRKPISSGRYLNFHSQHELKHKINLVIGLRNRIKRMVHPTEYLNDLNTLKHLLTENGYPRTLINRLLFSSPFNNPNPSSNEDSTNDEANTQRKFFSLPYIPDLTDNLISVFSGIDNIKISKKVHGTLDKILYTKTKDRCKPLDRINVIYNIKCGLCEGEYVGQTGRRLSTRIGEHKKDCNMMKPACGLSKHTVETGHKFNFEEFKVVRTCPNQEKRLFLEFMEIQYNEHSVNIMGDTNSANPIYCNLIEAINNKRSTNRTFRF